MKIFGTDVRVTVNYENKADYNQVKNLKYNPEKVRFKERTSFQIGWMRVDATRVQSGNQVEFECELEIVDTNYLI